MNRRTLTPEEQQLWRHVTRDAVPLRHDMTLCHPEGMGRPDCHPALVAGCGFHQDQTPPSGGVTLALTLGTYAGIDRNTANRFRKGDRRIDATLDLHGMTLEKAHHCLIGFIKSHYERGCRCLLVITGKGQKKSDLHRGLLREMLPAWLDTPGLKPLILALDVAQPKHGGHGAYYVLLRRKRHG